MFSSDSDLIPKIATEILKYGTLGKTRFKYSLTSLVFRNKLQNQFFPMTQRENNYF